MKDHYIVCEADGNRSLGGKDAEELESFPTFRAAEKRAKELAALEPGQEVIIYEAVAATHAPVGAPLTNRKSPTERHK
jgi:hypothetical protein